ncbi:MAG TPA: DUF2784 family protein [Vicinamibacterales bacterium]|nr:DUF2784 family protein [Vicinamibacterales bacterium]
MLADATVVIHFAFILFVVLGGLLVIRWPRLAWVHLPAAIWGAWIEFAGWGCPLTPLENWLRAASGEAVYTSSFIERYVVPVVYPAALSRPLQWLLGGFVVVINGAIYFVVLRRRSRRRNEPHPSVGRLWADYLAHAGRPASTPLPPVWHFCDNEADADLCAALVLAGRKRATAPSRWFFESQGLAPPQPTDLDIVTDGRGVACCVIRTTAVRTVPFGDVSAEHARLEGEGDLSLEYWRRTHRAYYARELARAGLAPTEDMAVVCQYFEVAFPVTSDRS